MSNRAIRESFAFPPFAWFSVLLEKNGSNAVRTGGIAIAKSVLQSEYFNRSRKTPISRVKQYRLPACHEHYSLRHLSGPRFLSMQQRFFLQPLIHGRESRLRIRTKLLQVYVVFLAAGYGKRSSEGSQE